MEMMEMGHVPKEHKTTEGNQWVFNTVHIIVPFFIKFVHVLIVRSKPKYTIVALLC